MLTFEGSLRLKSKAVANERERERESIFHTVQRGCLRVVICYALQQLSHRIKIGENSTSL